MNARRLLDALPVAAALVDVGGTVVETNQAWRDLGCAHPLPCPRAGENILDAVDGVADGAAPAAGALLRAVLGGGRAAGEIDYGFGDGADARRFRLEIRRLDDGSAVATHVDVSRHWRAAVVAEQHARRDALTGLTNRRGLYETLDRLLALSRREPSAMALIDLDGFKAINDRFGHFMGDLVLQRLGQRLARAARSADTVARLGGDEFVVLAPGIATHDQLTGLVDRLRQTIEDPVQAGGRTFGLRASVAAILLDGRVPDASTALTRVDQLMYRDKRCRHRWTTSPIATVGHSA